MKKIIRDIIPYLLSLSIILVPVSLSPTAGNIQAQIVQENVDSRDNLLAGHTPSLMISPQVLSELNLIARILDIATTEFLLCLGGQVNGEHATIDRIFKPSYHLFPFQGEVRVLMGSEICPPKATAWWHNHPRGVSGRCELSPKDVETAIKLQIPFVILHVNDYEWCWWSLRQIIALTKKERGGDSDKVSLKNLPGQITITDRDSK